MHRFGSASAGIASAQGHTTAREARRRLLIDHNSVANFVPVNTADNWLHLGLGIAMIALGGAATAAARTRTGARTSPRGA